MLGALSSPSVVKAEQGCAPRWPHCVHTMPSPVLDRGIIWQMAQIHGDSNNTGFSAISALAERAKGSLRSCKRTARSPAGVKTVPVASRHPLELNQPADVVGEVHHPDLEPRPRDADGAHDLSAPSSSAGGRIRVRQGREPSSAACSSTSGALTADDCVRRAGGYGSASASPSGPPRSAPSGRRCPPRPPCRYWRDRAHRPASDCRARARPSHPICGSACAPCPRRHGSCSRRSFRRSSSSSARPCPSVHSWQAASPIPPASCRLDRRVLLLRVALLGHRHNRSVNDPATARNEPSASRYWPKRANSWSISPASANASRNSRS
jgi:hypothetical protein